MTMKTSGWLSLMLACGFIAAAAVGGEDGFAFSAREGRTASWGNRYFSLLNLQDKNYLMTVRDPVDNQTLLLRSWLWYEGRSPDGKDLRHAYSEEKNIPLISCSERREDDKQIVETRYQTNDFDLVRETTLYADRAYLRLRYLLTARHDETPTDVRLPLLLFPKSFGEVIYNTPGGFSEPKPFGQLTAAELMGAHLFFLINRELNRTLVLGVNLNAPLDLGFPTGSTVSTSTQNWANFLRVQHPYLSGDTRLKNGQTMAADVHMTVYRGVEFDQGMRAAAQELENMFDLQPRFGKFDFEALEKEQTRPSGRAVRLAAPTGMEMWHETALKKVYPNTIPPERGGQGIVLQAARNEGESGQIALRPAADATLESFTISPLRTEDGAELPPAKPYFLEYQDIVTMASARGGLSGKMPDKLLPAAAFLPRTIPAGESQPLWFTVNIPADASADDYTGRVELAWRTRDGARHEAAIPLTVRVWNFALPARQPYRAFGVAWSANSVAVAERLGEYHFNNSLPVFNDQGRAIPPNGDNIKRFFDWDEGAWLRMDDFFQLARKAVDEWRYNALYVPFAYLDNVRWQPGQKTMFGLPVEDPEFEGKYKAYVRLAADGLRAAGLIDRAFIFQWDEVQPQHYGAMARTAAMAREAAPDLKVLIVGVPNPEVVETADIVVPGDIYTWWNADAARMIADARVRGKEFWYYENGRTFNQHAAAHVPRLVPWQSWPRGITGYLQWAMGAHWDKTFAARGQTWLIYPMQRPDEAPIASVRLEIFRDGIEDFAYFELMRSLPDEQREAFTREILEIAPLVGEPVPDITKMADLRDRIGAALSAAAR